MLKISRIDALGAGHKRFYTGRICKHGHDSERFVSTGGCVKCNAMRSALFLANSGKATNARAQGHFAYPLHPDDHAAALAYCQALDMARGRTPHSPPPPPQIGPRVDIAAARAQAFGIAARVAPRQDTGAGLLDALERDLTNPSSRT